MAVSHFFKVWNRYQKTRGLKWTVSRLKLFRLIVTRYLAGEPLHVAPYTSLTKDGLPTALGPINNIIRGGDSMNLRLVMTLLNLSRLVIGDTKAKIETSSITDPSASNGHPGFEAWLERKFPSNRPLFPNVSWKEPHWSTKQGPKGQCFATAGADLLTLPYALEVSLYILGGLDLEGYMKALKGHLANRIGDGRPGLEKSSIRKVQFISDREMKVRPVAIFDYWSQTALKPYHDVLMDWVAKQPGDCTYNQGSGLDTIRYESGPFHSLDLTSATDRFPLLTQKKVFEKFFGTIKAAAWAHTMVAYPFESPQGYLTYSAGQPMGAYSSWAMFTTCHHLILQYVATQTGCKYVVLGDDVVVTTDEGATLYKEVMTALGVEISEMKSHRSPHTFEFAKRWIHKGVEISPFTMAAALEAGTDISAWTELLRTNIQREWPLAGMSPGSISGVITRSGLLPGLATWIAVRVIRFNEFLNFLEKGGKADFNKLPSSPINGAQSLCFHEERASTCLAVGIYQVLMEQFKTTLSDCTKILAKSHGYSYGQGSADPATSATQASYEPGPLALRLLAEKAQIEVSQISKKAMGGGLDAATFVKEVQEFGRGPIKDFIETARLPDVTTYHSERRAVTARKALSRIYKDAESLYLARLTMPVVMAQLDRKLGIKDILKLVGP